MVQRQGSFTGEIIWDLLLTCIPILEEVVCWLIAFLFSECFQMKERRPLSLLKKDLEKAPPARDFLGALKAAYLRTNLPGLIAEVKKASPSRGILREDFDPVSPVSVCFFVRLHKSFLIPHSFDTVTIASGHEMAQVINEEQCK